MKTEDRIPWRQSEAKLASWFGKLVPCSGAVRELGKADAVGEGNYEGLRCENKWTEKQSYTLKLETLEKIKREAFQCGSSGWLFRVDFNGKPFIIISEDEYRSYNE